MRPKRRTAASLVAVLVICGLPGCASARAGESDGLVWDPWEPMNRGIFQFNETLDRWILEPVATAWDFVVPEIGQRCISNIFVNLAYPSRLVNNLLQLKIVGAFEDTGRFVANSTVGLAGCFDVATRGGLPQNDEDFGQTLGYWGAGAGPYFVIPILGPSNVRDTTGLLVDSALSVHGYFLSFPITSGMFVLDKLNDRSLALEAVAAERASAFDFYAAARAAHAQFREGQIRDRRDAPEAVPADDEDLYYFDDEDDDEEFEDES